MRASLRPRCLLELLVLVLVTVSAASSDSSGSSGPSGSYHFVSVCNHASEPTFSEIFSFVSPIAPSDLAGLAETVSELTSSFPAMTQEKEREEPVQVKEEHHWLLVRAFRDLIGRVGRALAEVSSVQACLLLSSSRTLRLTCLKMHIALVVYCMSSCTCRPRSLWPRWCLTAFFI